MKTMSGFRHGLVLTVMAAVVSITMVGAASSTVSAADLVLRVWTWDGPDGSKPIQDALDEFTKETGIKTKLESVTADYKPKLLAALAAGTAPDVFMVGDWDYAEFYRAGVLENLTPYIERDKIDLNAYVPTIVNQHRQPDGNFYTMSKDFSTMGIFYNKDHFDEAGIPYPTNKWTWNEALVWGQKLTRRDASGKVIRYGIFTDPEWVALTLSFAWGAGYTIMDKNFMTFKGYLDNPEAIKAMQFFIDLAAKYKIGPNGWAERDAIGHAEGAFFGGKASIVIYGNWPINRWRNETKLRWGTVIPPIYKVHSTTFVMEAGWGMAGGIKDPVRREAAWKLLSFLAGPKGQKHMVSTGWAMPSYIELAKELGITKDPYYSNFFLAAFESMPMYWAKVPNFGPVFADGFGDVIRDAMFGRRDLQTGIAAYLPVAEARLQKAISEYRKK
ncbi:MAG: sugar ABC transporter substrate-binding protein [Limnochordales bacterium]|nr:sugar ABC transporter substrate-binding protein [Limnochordales bacterium]